MKWILIIILMFVTVPIAFGMANYGALDFGECDYGENSPPDIDAFQPTDVTPTIIYGENSTFNITFSDCEGDAVKLEWFFNTTLNQTSGNLTFNKSEVGIYNITANVSDTYDNTYQEWTVTVFIYVPPGANITDVLIVPSLSSIGSLIVVTANITSNTSNLTGLYAYLNIDGDFAFLTETPQNQSVGDVYTINVTQVRWFLATPQERQRYGMNVSYTNDTLSFQGEHENLILTSEVNEMEIAIVLVVIFVIGLYFIILVNLFAARSFSEHGLIKLLFLMVAFWILLLPVNMAIQYNDTNGGPVAVTTYLELLYQIMIWLNSFIVVYFMLWFITQIFKKIGMAKDKLRIEGK